MNKGGVRQGTRTGKRCERREKEGKKTSERRTNARKESEGGVKEEKVDGERKQQRMIVASENSASASKLAF